MSSMWVLFSSVDVGIVHPTYNLSNLPSRVQHENISVVPVSLVAREPGEPFVGVIAAVLVVSHVSSRYADGIR